MNHCIKFLATAVSFAVAGSSLAAVTADEAKELGGKLTPWGAEVAGNKEGTIPAYTGGGAKPPANYDKSKPGVRPDPFANEKPLFSITPANYMQHADKISEGQKAMFKKYPTYRMDIYPTHRTARYPKWYLANTLKNATGCKNVAEGLQLENCLPGEPFPVPKTGSEVMWNRALSYQSNSFGSDDQLSTVVDARGSVFTTAGWTTRTLYPIFDAKRTTTLGVNEEYEIRRMDYNAPARKAGEKLVLRDTLNMKDSGRRAWSYLAGQRRVKLAPDVSYDTPTPTGAGIGTVDDSQLFFGSIDRYDWKILGKKEMFIPYNTFKMHDAKACPAEVVFTKNHLNPDCLRFELHRVWIVEGKLKAGLRHVYPRRIIYSDEDFLRAGVADSFDAAGAPFRFVQVQPVSMYETEGQVSEEFTTHDLQTGAYTRQAYPTGKSGWETSEPMNSSWYTADALTGAGVK